MVRKHQDKQYKRKIINEIEIYDEILKKAGKVIAIIPRVQELKEEAINNLKICNEVPEEFLEEIMPCFERDYDKNLKNISTLNASIPDIAPRTLHSISSASAAGTAAFTAVLVNNFPPYQDRPLWAQNVLSISKQIAEIKAQKDSLPDFLDLFQQGLGKDFRDAEDNYLKAKSEIITTDLAANSMRNLLQQIWGSFINKARRLSDSPLDINHYELKKQSCRNAISRLISKNIDADILEDQFHNIYLLYCNLSELSKYSEKPDSMKRLDELHTNWILLIDSLRNYF